MTRAAITHPIKRLLFAAGYYKRRLRRHSLPGVAVLCYHGVRGDDWPAGTMQWEQLHVREHELAAHCRLLRQFCDPISLADWRAARAGGPPLPARPVLVTFDDGYRSVATRARPILERFGIPAVVFACTEPIERRESFWHDAVLGAYGEAEVERAKTVTFAEWDALRTRCRRLVADDDAHAPLTVADLRALADTPGIEIAAHTAAHPILAHASVDEQRVQIERCKAQLEAWTGRPVTAFAYPNGRPRRDYTGATVGLVNAGGFTVAFTTRPGFARADTPALELPRFLMLSDVSAAELAHRLCFSWRR